MTPRRILLASVAVRTLPVAFDSTPQQRAYLAGLIALGQAAAAQRQIGVPNEGINDDLAARNKDSEWMLNYWGVAADLVAGYDAIKAQGEKYLPKFADEGQNEYDARLELTKLTNVYRDVVETLAGKPFQEPIAFFEGDEENKIAIPEQIIEFAKDVDGAGNDLTSFAANVFFNGINSAIDWIFIDYPNVAPGTVRSRQDVKQQNIRPFWSHVLGQNILEARVEVIGGKETLTYLRILEPGDETHVRIFERIADGNVIWGLFIQELRGDKKIFHLVDSGGISIGVIPLVPFITGRRDGRSFKFFPVMRDAADLQIDLFQAESGLKFAKVMTAYPMLAANGIKPEMEADNKTPKRIAVGPSRVLWSRPDGNGNAGNWTYVSPEAQCLIFLKDHIKETMDQLRELGRQPLTAQSGNLTVITTAYAAGKAKSAVSAWGLRLKMTLENALAMTCAWMGIKDGNPQIKIFDEYDDFTTDQAADLTALNTMRTNKDLSHEDLIIEMQRRSVLRPDFNDEANMKRLLDETPSDDETGDDDGVGIEPPPNNEA